MKLKFMDTIDVLTDRMGGWKDQSITIGFYSITDDTYYSLDEVRQLYDSGKTENVYESDDSKLHLGEFWLDYRVAFRVVCGTRLFPIGDTDLKNLELYCKQYGIISEVPTPINMMCGIKMLYIDGTDAYRIVYSIYDDIWENMLERDKQYLKKVFIGKINRLRYKFNEVHRSGEVIKEYHLFCGDVEFSENNFIVPDISKKTVGSRVLMDAIREFDIQVYICRTNFINYHNVFDAVIKECLNRGQEHLVKLPGDFSDLYWYDPIKFMDTYGI